MCVKWGKVDSEYFNVSNGVRQGGILSPKLRAAFNNAYRRVLGQPWRCSASAMYANFGINNFEATIRKSTFGFIQRLAKSTNSLIVTIEKSWSVRIDIWSFWEKTLYIATAT